MSFFVTTGSDCKRKMKFIDNEPALVLYIHHDMEPLKFQAPIDDLSYDKLLENLNVSIV